MPPTVVRFELGGRQTPGGRLLTNTAASLWRCAVDDIAVERTCVVCGGPHGRPRLQVVRRRARWGSVARSESTTVVAISIRPVGIDVEDGDLDDPVLRTWVRREAVLKATGDGLAVEPDRLELGPADEPPRVVRWHLATRRPKVQIADLHLGAGRVAAIAVLGRRLPYLDVAGASAGEGRERRLP